MDTGLLHLHNLLRWLILILLVWNLYNAFAKKQGIVKSSLWLLITAHITLLVGLYQLIWGRFGIAKGLPEGVELMKDKFYRFFWVEHPLLMILAILLITLGRGKAKKLNYKSAGWLFLIALLFILTAIPWPFRELVGRPLIP